MLASANGHEKVVEFLWSVGADIATTDKDGKTALDYASTNGKQNMLKFFQTHLPTDSTSQVTCLSEEKIEEVTYEYRKHHSEGAEGSVARTCVTSTTPENLSVSKSTPSTSGSSSTIGAVGGISQRRVPKHRARYSIMRNRWRPRPIRVTIKNVNVFQKSIRFKTVGNLITGEGNINITHRDPRREEHTDDNSNSDMDDDSEEHNTSDEESDGFA